jgi:hypothetical protein
VSRSHSTLAARVIPTPWVALILALGTFRLVRLVGWDDLTKNLRNRAGGRNERNRGEPVFVDDPRGTFTRPGLIRFLVCPWCVGFWISGAMYAFWYFAPTASLYVAAPFALSAVVGLVAKHLDP